ncbi:MAG: glutaredoxin family protein, partial [Myxococcota bacterium]
GPSATSPGEDAAARVVVDEPNLRYLYRTGSGANRSTLSLESIPPGYRLAVAVQGGSLPQGDGSGEELFVVDLTQAKPGDEVDARLMNRDRLMEVSAAGVAAASLAIDVVEFASYHCEVSFSTRTDGRYISFIVEDGGEMAVKRMFMQDDPEPLATSFKKPFAAPSPEREPAEEDSPWARIFGDHGEEESSAKVKDISEWKEVVVYSTSWCGACKQARSWLDQNEVPHTYLDIERDSGARERMAEDAKRLGVRANSIPMFVIGSGSSAKTMSGWSPTKFVSLAKAE